MQIFAPDGPVYREGTWCMGKGAPLCLNGGFYLAFHINRAHIAAAEPGNCPSEPFSLPLKWHSQYKGAGALAPQIYQHTKGALYSK